MVNETLNALSRLDYDNYEVLVSTTIPRIRTVWRPVEAHCACSGPAFRFFHFNNVAGFKAGALNEALDA